MLGPLCNETVNLETDGKTLHYSLRKLMPTWAKMIPYLRIKTLKKQTLWGGETYLSVQYIGLGAPPGTTPLGKGLDWQSLLEK